MKRNERGREGGEACFLSEFDHCMLTLISHKHFLFWISLAILTNTSIFRFILVDKKVSQSVRQEHDQEPFTHSFTC